MTGEPPTQSASAELPSRGGERRGDGGDQVGVHASRQAIVTTVGLALQPLSPVMASIGQALIIGIAVARFVVDPGMRREVTDLFRRPVAWLGIVVVAWSLAALLWSADPVAGLSRGLMVRAVVVAVAMTSVMSRPWMPILGMAIGCSLESIVQTLMYTGLLADQHNDPWTISGGLSPHPGNTAAWAGVAAFLLVGRMVDRASRSSDDRRRSGGILGEAALVVFGMVSVVIAGNRSLLVGVPVAVVALVLTMLPRISRSWRRRVIVGLVAIAASGAALPIVAPDLPPVIRVRGLWREVSSGMQAVDADATDTSGGLRVLWWRESLVIARSAPWIGHGSGSTRAVFADHLATLDPDTVPHRAYTDNPHSSIVFELVEHGLVGLMLVGGFLVAMLASVIGRVRRTPALAGLPAAWIMLLAFAAGNTIQLSMYPLMLTATLVALSVSPSQPRSNSHSHAEERGGIVRPSAT